MDVAFPRGKLAAVPSGSAASSHALASDRLFGGSSERGSSAKPKAAGQKGKPQREGAVSSPRTRSAPASRQDSATPASVVESGAGASRLADELSFKRLRPGMAVLARVRRVAGDQVTLALPHGLTAQCRAIDCNEILADLVHSGGHADGGDASETEGVEAGAGTAGGHAALLAALPVGRFVRAVVTRVGGESLTSSRDAALQLAASLGSGVDARTGDRRISASLRPELANQGVTLAQLRPGSLVSGYVSSVEDHGFVVALGIPGLTAFLPFDAMDGTAGQAGAELSRARPGTPIWATVSEVDRASGTVKLACTAAHVAGARAKESTHTLLTVKPGLRVSCKVDRVLPNGLAVTFLAFFKATLHLHHLPQPASSAWQAAYKPGQEIAARVLYVDAVEKSIALSAAPHVVSLGLDDGAAAGALVGIGGPSFDHGDGSVVDGAVVLRVDVGAGMLLGWGVGWGGAGSAAAAGVPVEKRLAAAAEWGRTAYVHISRVADEKVEHIEKLFRPGSAVSARILGAAGIEGHATAATKASIVQAAVLRVADVVVGSTVEGVVESVAGVADAADAKGKGAGGRGGSRASAEPPSHVDFAAGKGVLAVVRLGEGVKALVTAIHAADVLPKQAFASTKARKAFLQGAGLLVGSKIKVRILSVDAAASRIQATLKRTLMHTSLPVLASFEDAARAFRASSAEAPLVSHGFVTSVRENGLIVTFFGGVHGLVPLPDLVAAGHIRADQIVQVPSSAAAARGGTVAAAPLAAMTALFSLGQVLKVRIAAVQAEKRKMRLSLRLTVPAEVAARAAAEISEGPLASLGPGTLVDASVVGLVPAERPDRVVVRVTHFYSREEADGGRVVWARHPVQAPADVDDTAGDDAAAAAEDGVLAELPLIQLSDCRPVAGSADAAGEEARATLAPGTPLEGLVVLQRLSAKRRVSVAAAAAATASSSASLGGPPRLLLTAKPLLCAAARAAPDMLPAAVERVHAGQAVVGFVASVTAFGAFVRFLDGCTGLCPRSKWPKQVTDAAAAAAGSGEAAAAVPGTQAARDYAVGDTVVASVDSVLLPTADEGGGGGSANTTQSRSRFTLTLQTGLVSKALPASYLAAGAPAVGSGDSDDDLGAASLAASALRSWLLDDESRRCAAPAGAGVPARSAYPIGARMLARVESVDAESVRLLLPAPPSAMQTASASVGLSAVAVLGGGSPAVQVGQFMRVEVLDALESDVLVELLEAVEPPATPAAAPVRGSAKKAKAKPGKDAPALTPALPRHFDVGDIAPAAASLKLRLGELVDVTVLAAPAGLGAAAYVPVRLAATPSVVAYAAVSDIIGGPTDPSTLVPGAALRAIVTQLPSATFSAAFAESMAPRARAAAALSGLLLLSAAPALVGLRSAAGASGKRGAGGRGVAVADLVPGMILSAMLRPRGGGAGTSGVGNHGGGGAGQKRRRGSSIGGEDVAAAAASGPTSASAAGGDAGRTRGSSSRHGSATEGRLPPLHVTLIGVHGRYDARLSAAECVDALSLGSAPAALTAAATAAAGQAALARYFELLSSPPGTVVQVKVAVVARERRQRRGGAGGEEGDDAAPGAAGEIPELVHRVELTCRAADLALPDLHLASCRPDWCGSSAAREEEGVRIAGADSVIAAAGASAAPLSDCAAAAAFCGGGPSTLVRGATGVGVVLGVSAADGHLWLGVGGGVHARVALVDCGSTNDICDPVTGDLHASSVVAAALHASRIHELHPPGSLVPFVLLDVSAQDRRATAGLRQAAPALAASLTPPVSAKQAAAAAAGKGSKKARGSAAAADSSPVIGLGGFAAAVLRVQSWLTAATAAASTPGRVALAQVIGGMVPQQQKKKSDAAAAGGPAAGAGATSLRLLLGGLIGARADVTELADRADWTDNPAASLTPGDIVVATVLPPLAAGGSSDEGAYSSTLAVSLRPSVAAVAAKFAKASGAPEAAPGPSKALAAASAAIVAAETAEATAAARVGAVVSGFVVSSGPKGVFVRIARGLSARVGLSQLSDQYLRDPARVFPTGRLVTGVVTATAADSGRCEMSLRRAAVKSALAAGGGASEVARAVPSERRLGWADLRVGLVLGGQVTKVADYGVFIALEGTDRRLLADSSADAAPGGGRKRRRSGGGQGAEAVVPISGLCHISEIDASGAAGASKARGALAGRFSVGDHVRTAVASVDAAAKVISLTLKASAVAAGDLGADDDATAAAVADDNEDEDDEEDEEDADDDDGEEEDGGDDEEEDEESEPAAPVASAGGAAARRGAAAAAPPPPRAPAAQAGAGASRGAAQARTAGIFSALLDGDEDGSAPSTLPSGPSSAAASAAAGIWGDAAEGDEAGGVGEDDEGDSEDSGADEEGGAPSTSALRRRRKQARAASEVETSRREGLLASGAADANPETAEDFERLAKGHPNSSLVWIKYIAWLAQLSELGKARAVADRALSTINFREEQEKLNVWTALLNLEAQLGDAPSLGRVFARAQAAADPEAIHFALIGVYGRAGEARRREAEALFKVTAKKFGRSAHRVWAMWAAFLLRGGDAEGARALLPKALAALPKPRHVQVIEQFALLEYRFAAPADAAAAASSDGAAGPLGRGAGLGSQERGRTLFESLIATLPGRLDLWNVYLDQEVAAFARKHPQHVGGGAGRAAAEQRSTELAALRRLFDRASSLRLSTKKMKFMLKKALAFESAHGDAAGAARVQAAARAYVEGLVRSGGGEARDAAAAEDDEGEDQEEAQ